VERSAVFLAVVVVVMFMAYGVFHQSPHAVERAVGFGSGAVGLISFAYAVYRGLINAISNHAARWARENIVKPIAAFLVVANEDLKRKPLDEIAADAQKAKTIAETILKALALTFSECPSPRAYPGAWATG
jgi:hypothetical protein